MYSPSRTARWTGSPFMLSIPPRRGAGKGPGIARPRRPERAAKGRGASGAGHGVGLQDARLPGCPWSFFSKRYAGQGQGMPKERRPGPAGACENRSAAPGRLSKKSRPDDMRVRSGHIQDSKAGPLPTAETGETEQGQRSVSFKRRSWRAENGSLPNFV